MNLRIEYIGRTESDTAWLVDALDGAGQSSTVQFRRIDDAEEFDLPEDLPSIDVRVIDRRIGESLTELLLDVLTVADPSVPLLIAAQSDIDKDLIRYVSRGAEDILRIGEDTSERVAWSLRFAIDRHELLRVTQSAESRIRSVVEHLREGVVILDEAGRVMYANPA
ncbi:MAG: PAS domain-containing protein, partial [Rhodothermales bacterium]|nr:PAS domain-containing protein [Rhodothermales bacterium]